MTSSDFATGFFTSLPPMVTFCLISFITPPASGPGLPALQAARSERNARAKTYSRAAERFIVFPFGAVLADGRGLLVGADGLRCVLSFAGGSLRTVQSAIHAPSSGVRASQAFGLADGGAAALARPHRWDC